MRIDAHQHFWYYDKSMRWINQDMSVIRKDFLPCDLAQLLKKTGMDGSIAVQADQSEKETAFLLSLAEENPFIKGVIGWVDLRAADIVDRLSEYRLNAKLKGLRHILQAESPSFMLQPDFVNGIAAMGSSDLIYELLLFPQHLPAALALVKKFPYQVFVLDHMAKPSYTTAITSEWKQGIIALAANENVYCKISGMVTEASWATWKQEDFVPYLDTVSSAFGTQRLIFGSDWPVCLLAASYEEVKGIPEAYFASFSVSEQDTIFGGNAERIYHLK